MEYRDGFREGDRLNASGPAAFPAFPAFPAWRAFGPGAPGLPGWVAPPGAVPLPRTALRILDGPGPQWERHLSRLRSAAAQLGWDVAWLREVEPLLMAWMQATGEAVCRLQLFPDALSARLEDLPDQPPSFRLLPMAHPLGDVRENVRATFKGLMGAWDIRARNLARAGLADDALLLWPDDLVAETTMAAIGLQLDGELVLPLLDGRVSSITEAISLPLWASSRGLAVRHRPIRLDEVSGGQLWCMNAVRGLWQAEVVQL